jgi:hypothetical protein
MLQSCFTQSWAATRSTLLWTRFERRVRICRPWFILCLTLAFACLAPHLSAQASGPAFLVRDINLAASSSPSNLTVVKDQLFFVANDG